MSATTVTFEAVAPIISVTSLEQALEYYQRVLGFKLAWQAQEPARLASVCRDHVALNLSESDSGWAPSRMYIQVVGVERYYDELLEAGVKPAIPLAERTYGMRDFRISDSSGNELSFGEPTTGQH
jgi:uncharacterized glyoxalase superfamily protein PhnB